VNLKARKKKKCEEGGGKREEKMRRRSFPYLLSALAHAEKIEKKLEEKEKGKKGGGTDRRSVLHSNAAEKRKFLGERGKEKGRKE